MEGTLSVQPRANKVIGFDDYFFSLNVKNNTRNPWFIGKVQLSFSVSAYGEINREGVVKRRNEGESRAFPVS